MEALPELLAKSGANIGLICYSIFVTIAWTLADRERKSLSTKILQVIKDNNEALSPIERIVTQCQTMLEILTRGRR